MRYALILSCTSLVLMLGVVGCAGPSSNDGSVKSLSQADADKLNAPHNAFETSQDPPINANTRLAAGQLAEVQGAYGEALKQYQEALKLDPKNDQAMYRIAVIQTQSKQFPEAIESWKQYVAATNGSPAAYNNLGFCCEMADKMPEAEQAYQAGIAKDPMFKACRVNYGLLLARTNRKDEAMGQFQTVLTPAESHYDLGSVCEEQGDKDAAKAEYEKALSLDPKFHDAKQRLAKLN